MGARARIPLARAATVTAGSRQVPLKLLQGRSRHWSDPKALRKKGSPGRTVTAAYMAGQAGQSLGNNFNVDIDFGEEPQPAVAARVLTSSQLQAPRPYRPGPAQDPPVLLLSPGTTMILVLIFSRLQLCIINSALILRGILVHCIMEKILLAIEIFN